MSTRRFAAVLFAVAMPTFLPTAPTVAEEKPAVEGYGPWKLGDSREAVRAVESHGPYLDVPSTSGLETYGGEFLGKPAHISFVFDDRGLFLIQLWLYTSGEPSEFDEATAALHQAYEYLQAEFGAVHSDGLAIGKGLTLDELRALIPSTFRDESQRIDLNQALQAGAEIKTRSLSFHLHPSDPPPGADVSSSLFYNPQLGMYWVFLYFRNGPS